MKEIEQFANYSAADYCDAVSFPKTAPDEAVYYLLQKRLRHALHHVFEIHGFGLDEDFDDTINDFFLYLYEGNDQRSHPFSILRTIHNKQAFFGWMVSTYRNFLLNVAKEAVKQRAFQAEMRTMVAEDGNGLDEDTMIQYLATAIAYADQRFLPGNLFILYRSLLSLLDHSRAIPQEEMAAAMKMHPVTYRVRCKRQRDCFQGFILSQETGHQLDLDSRHDSMRMSIVDEFNRLYELLIGYYNEVLEKLPAKNDIHALRLRYGWEKGIVMHEQIRYGYRFSMDLSQFYRALKS